MNNTANRRPAPVRRETERERMFRRRDQIPGWYLNKFLRRREEQNRIDSEGRVESTNVRVNDELTAGKAKYVKAITMPSAFAVKAHTAGR